MLRTVGQKSPCGALCFASFLKQLFPRGDSALHPPSTGGSSLEPPNVTLRLKGRLNLTILGYTVLLMSKSFFDLIIDQLNLQ